MHPDTILDYFRITFSLTAISLSHSRFDFVHSNFTSIFDLRGRERADIVLLHTEQRRVYIDNNLHLNRPTDRRCTSPLFLEVIFSLTQSVSQFSLPLFC